MMIPSEMPSVTMGENGHGNGHFKSEPGNTFQHSDQIIRSHLFGQMPGMGSNQLQMLQNLQNIAGRKQKEQEQNRLLTDSAEGAKREVPHLMQELQLNILQQSHIMQSGEKAKSSQQLHQLQSKQQQLVAQLQFAQHAITLALLAGKQEEGQTQIEQLIAVVYFEVDEVVDWILLFLPTALYVTVVRYSTVTPASNVELLFLHLQLNLSVVYSVPALSVSVPLCSVDFVTSVIDLNPSQAFVRISGIL
jgi:hypothetical protein